MQKVENIVANGEIACFEQFLLLQQYFQKSSAAETTESVYMWEMVNKMRAYLFNRIENIVVNVAISPFAKNISKVIFCKCVETAKVIEFTEHWHSEFIIIH